VGLEEEQLESTNEGCAQIRVIGASIPRPDLFEFLVCRTKIKE